MAKQWMIWVGMMSFFEMGCGSPHLEFQDQLENPLGNCELETPIRFDQLTNMNFKIERTNPEITSDDFNGLPLEPLRFETFRFTVYEMKTNYIGFRIYSGENQKFGFSDDYQGNFKFDFKNEKRASENIVHMKLNDDGLALMMRYEGNLLKAVQVVNPVKERIAGGIYRGTGRTKTICLRSLSAI